MKKPIEKIGNLLLFFCFLTAAGVYTLAANFTTDKKKETNYRKTVENSNKRRKKLKNK